jgi:hypothetical protein
MADKKLMNSRDITMLIDINFLPCTQLNSNDIEIMLETKVIHCNGVLGYHFHEEDTLKEMTVLFQLT